MVYKSVKDQDKDDFYQQYYWLVKAEQLKTYPHLKEVKPKVLYEFVKKVNPQNPTKKLDERGKELRATAELSLNQYFKNKNLDNNAVLMYNIETYVDPSKGQYYTKVDAEKLRNWFLRNYLHSIQTIEIQEKTRLTIYGSTSRKTISTL
ncbi:hypothetical protein ACFOEQ_23180 [Chryseobacterium arachidis]|uniref:hypothetical protein n=1 Tax=Chryseobacterium arachidis TaxID=1416778 RepID=UPI003622D9C1